MSNKTFDVVVLGGGPAGITAARYLKMNKPSMSVVVIRPEEYSMIYCAEPYVIEGMIPLKKTFKPDSKTTEYGAELIRGRAKAVDFNKKSVGLESGEELFYEKLFISTGSFQKIPEIPGVEFENVFTLKTQKDLVGITNAAKTARNIVVVGAGSIGIELSQSFLSSGKNVSLIEMKDSILANLVDREMTEELLQELKEIDLKLNQKVTEIYGSGNKASAVVLADCSTIEADIVVFAVSTVPNITMFEGSGLEIGKFGIKVNRKMETNIKDVYAAGDCVDFQSIITGQSIPGKLATNAVPMAKVAVSNILGIDREYEGYVNGAVTKVGKWFVGGTGLSETMCQVNNIEYVAVSGESTAKFSMMPDPGKIKVKLIFEKKSRKIIGGQAYGTTAIAERIDLISFGIQNKNQVLDYVKFSYCSQPYQTFFPSKNAIVEAAEKALQKFSEK